MASRHPGSTEADLLLKMAARSSQKFAYTVCHFSRAITPNTFDIDTGSQVTARTLAVASGAIRLFVRDRENVIIGMVHRMHPDCVDAGFNRTKEYCLRVAQEFFKAAHGAKGSCLRVQVARAAARPLEHVAATYRRGHGRRCGLIIEARAIRLQAFAALVNDRGRYRCYHFVVRGEIGPTNRLKPTRTNPIPKSGLLHRCT